MTTVKATRAATRVGRAASTAKAAFRRVEPAACMIGNSFLPDTQVLMANGSYLPIIAIEAGDYVLASDPETAETHAEPVLELIVGFGTRHLVQISVEDDSSFPGLTATANHPIWIIGKSWIDVSEVKAGDRMISPNGTPVPISEARDLGEAPGQIVFNLNVGDLHTFSVRSGSSAIVVHNCAKSVPRAPHKREKDFDHAKKFDTLADATKKAMEVAYRGGGRCRFRGVCNSGDHVHVDYFNADGSLARTEHFKLKDHLVRKTPPIHEAP